jgi:NAD(P)-dependent dehydrogenase (short-subunit alcohol dehydrogenase family)
MDLDLNGRTAFVSGSTAGIGLAIATGLAGAGAAVIVNGRTQARVDQAIAAVRAEVPGANVQGLAADLGTAAGAGAVAAAHPEVDVLVNNLGIFEPKPFADIDDADWMRFFETNVVSGARLSRAYLPHMRARNWGRIVFISSDSGLHIPAEMIH